MIVKKEEDFIIVLFSFYLKKIKEAKTVNAEKKEMTFMDEVNRTVEFDPEIHALIEEETVSGVQAWTLDGKEVSPDGSNE